MVAKVSIITIETGVSKGTMVDKVTKVTVETMVTN
jgi:hypothetical protein